jgi:hypothetical protein
MKIKEPLFTTDRLAIIQSVWDSMPPSQKALMIQTVREILKEQFPDAKPLASTEIVLELSWKMGFHYAMICMEQGALIKGGEVTPENN